jgi:acylphosphatase
MPTRSIVVQGRVQGVGFRAHAARVAAHLGIEGEVWNRRDGSVEVTAYHPDPAVLDRFVEQLKLGPGHIENLWADDAENRRAYLGFEIGPTR